MRQAEAPEHQADHDFERSQHQRPSAAGGAVVAADAPRSRRLGSLRSSEDPALEPPGHAEQTDAGSSGIEKAEKGARKLERPSGAGISA